MLLLSAQLGLIACLLTTSRLLLLHQVFVAIEGFDYQVREISRLVTNASNWQTGGVQ